MHHVGVVREPPFKLFTLERGLFMKKKIRLCTFVLLLATTSLTSFAQGNSPMVSSNPPPQSCVFIKQITGSKGNQFTGRVTSNKKLEEGAMEDLMKQAMAVGANYIELTTNRAGETGSARLVRPGFNNVVNHPNRIKPVGRSKTQQTNVTMTGSAFKCPAGVYGLK
jgi:lysyl-tRNA synthetase class II